MTTRPTTLGLALFNAANKLGNNHPVSFVVKRKLAQDQRPYLVREGKKVHHGNQ